MTRILVVDNFDSFVYTLAGYLSELGADVEILALDAGRHQPPVIGGKNATSRTPDRGAAKSAISWSTATRTARMSAKASA